MRVDGGKIAQKTAFAPHGMITTGHGRVIRGGAKDKKKRKLYRHDGDRGEAAFRAFALFHGDFPLHAVDVIL